MITTQNLQKYNSTVDASKKASLQQLLFKIAAMSFQELEEVLGTLHLRHRRNIKATVKRYQGMADAIQWQFPVQGWFVEHGVRKGVKVGSPQATPRPWLVPTINKVAEELADQLIEILGDEAFEAFGLNKNLRLR